MRRPFLLRLLRALRDARNRGWEEGRMFQVKMSNRRGPARKVKVT